MSKTTHSQHEPHMAYTQLIVHQLVPGTHTKYYTTKKIYIYYHHIHVKEKLPPTSSPHSCFEMHTLAYTTSSASLVYHSSHHPHFDNMKRNICDIFLILSFFLSTVNLADSMTIQYRCYTFTVKQSQAFE